MGLTREFKLTTTFIVALAISSIIVEAKPFPGFSHTLSVKLDARSNAPASGAPRVPVAPGGGAIFPITNYGAKSDGKSDSTMSFQKAWRDACHSNGPAKVLVPAGTFKTGEVIFTGPCTAAPITFEIQGTMLGTEDLSMYSQNQWITIEHVNNVIVTGPGTLDGLGASAWKHKDDSFGGGVKLPVSLVFFKSNNSVAQNFKTVNSKGFHIKVLESDNVIVQNVTIIAPGDSPNTDGVHISRSQNVTVADSKIGTGDDCVSIGAGNTNITVIRVECGPGHGLSVGSLGKWKDETDLRGVTITNCTLTNTKNGARIKSYRQSPSLSASGIVFDDIVMNGVFNPIIIDQNYASSHLKQGSNVKLSDIHFRNIRGVSLSKVAVTLNCSSAFPCQGVELVDINLSSKGAGTSDGVAVRSACQNVKPTFSGKMNPASCLA
ncbi:exopolygalacturonase [Heracleum sosnowskyi]|uniref:Exopolygalacturonase n=1 Tax=Heracleum sosnowskyi TaxID=360622 RepID=A0AAD8J8G8_9APIA|nr:exopolygalacturonase [Heracleum sosnowskyi]KAK1398830.1 exopolygalacturonase [Heracleum sosnowskyi]KAK1398834.1 exopolygalacturonase [Heracleum sosnowskyi]KAK1398838.1 exopolygalacturonase [Heracleum sosnowskyi]